jgi:hypothetical protein
MSTTVSFSYPDSYYMTNENKDSLIWNSYFLKATVKGKSYGPLPRANHWLIGKVPRDFKFKSAGMIEITFLVGDDLVSYELRERIGNPEVATIDRPLMHEVEAVIDPSVYPEQTGKFQQYKDEACKECIAGSGTVLCHDVLTVSPTISLVSPNVYRMVNADANVLDWDSSSLTAENREDKDHPITYGRLEKPELKGKKPLDFKFRHVQTEGNPMAHFVVVITFPEGDDKISYQIFVARERERLIEAGEAIDTPTTCEPVSKKQVLDVSHSEANRNDVASGMVSAKHESHGKKLTDREYADISYADVLDSAANRKRMRMSAIDSRMKNPFDSK